MYTQQTDKLKDSERMTMQMKSNTDQYSSLKCRVPYFFYIFYFFDRKLHIRSKILEFTFYMNFEIVWSLD